MTDAGVRIRVAGPAELPGIGELTVAAYSAGGVLALGTTDPYAAVLRDPASRPAGTTVLLATDPESPARMLGAVTYVPAGSAMAQVARGREVELRMLAVAPGQQGRGVGAALVRAAVDRASDRGVPAVVLCVVSTSGGARSLYERLGFTRAPDRDRRPDPGLELLAYRLELG